MKLSGIERQILYLALMNADLSVPEVARCLGCRDHLVRQTWRKFEDLGILTRRVMIDVFRLGYSRHAFYLSLSSEGQRKREEIASFLVDYFCTSVVLQVGGEYDFFVSIVAQSATEIAEFNQDLSARFGPLFSKKDVAVTIRHSVFGEKLLLSNSNLVRECFYDVSVSRVDVDDLDRLIIYALGSPDFSNYTTLARILGLPVTTIDYRIKRLKSLGVISGDMHELRGELAGFANYIILVSMKGLSREMHDKFYGFVRNHPNVAHFSFEVGHWDYMLGTPVRSASEVNSLIDLIHREFGHFVSSVKSFPMFRAHKVRDYPIVPKDAGKLRRAGNF